MDHDQMVMRAGFYCGLAERELGDRSYALRWIGRAQDLTEEAFWSMAAEISARLRAAGKLPADVDPYDEFMRMVTAR